MRCSHWSCDLFCVSVVKCSVSKIAQIKIKCFYFLFCFCVSVLLVFIIMMTTSVSKIARHIA